MPASFVRDHGGANEEVSDTTFPVKAAVAAVPAGNLLLYFLAFDNLTATTPTASISAMTLVARGDSPQAAAGAGVKGELWRDFDALASGSGWTTTLSAAVTEKVMYVLEFAGVDTTTPLRGTPTTGIAASASGSFSAHSPQNGDLCVAFCVSEQADGAPLPTIDSGAWDGTISYGTTGGGATANASLSIAWKVYDGSFAGFTAPALTDGYAMAVTFRGAAGAPSNVTVNPAAIASAEAFGSPTIGGSVTVSPGGIASGEAHGSPTVTQVPPAITVSPAAIASGEALGTPGLSTVVTVSPTGVPSAQALGSPTIGGSVTVSPGGISSGEAVGSPTLTVQPPGQTVNPSPIASAEALGTPTLSTVVTVSPGGIPTGEALGAPAIATLLTASPLAIPSAQAFGTPTIAWTVTVAPNGIPSAQALGVPVVTGGLVVTGFSGWGIPIS